MDIFFEIHNQLPREAPGDDKSTLQAFALLPDLPPRPLSLDIGCRPGATALALSGQTAGEIIAVDNHRPYLARLMQMTQSRGFGDKIKLVGWIFHHYMNPVYGHNGVSKNGQHSWNK